MTADLRFPPSIERSMDLDHARFNMIEQQIRTWEVLDQEVLDLLYVVRREEFVPEAYRALAFSDLEIPLSAVASVPGGANQKMFQPKMEARIVQEVQPKKRERVLEIGAGSGYMAALLAARGEHVVSVEIDSGLKAFAERNLARSEIANVMVELGDAARGWAKHAPYDVIVVSGSLPLMPHTLLEQLSVGGRLFAIVGDAPVMEGRLMTCVIAGSSYNSINLFETCVAPLRGALQPDRFKF